MTPNTSLKLCAVLIAAIILVTWMGVSCSQRAIAFDKENNVTRIHNGNRVYEIEHKGATYLVIQTHKGIGICQKTEN